MNLNEFILFVRSQVAPRGSDVADSIIIMHLNNTIKRISKYFPDIFARTYTQTATEGLDNIALPSDFGRFEKFTVGNYEYFLTPDDITFKNDIYHRCWLSNEAIYFTPAAGEGDEITLYYLARPNDLASLSDQIPIPDDTHIDLGLMVASYIAPTNDLIMERNRVEMDFRRRYKRFKPFHEVKNWKEIIRKDINGVK